MNLKVDFLEIYILYTYFAAVSEYNIFNGTCSVHICVQWHVNICKHLEESNFMHLSNDDLKTVHDKIWP